MHVFKRYCSQHHRGSRSFGGPATHLTTAAYTHTKPPPKLTCAKITPTSKHPISKTIESSRNELERTPNRSPSPIKGDVKNRHDHRNKPPIRVPQGFSRLPERCNRQNQVSRKQREHSNFTSSESTCINTSPRQLVAIRSGLLTLQHRKTWREIKVALYFFGNTCIK